MAATCVGGEQDMRISREADQIRLAIQDRLKLAPEPVCHGMRRRSHQHFRIRHDNGPADFAIRKLDPDDCKGLGNRLAHPHMRTHAGR